MKSHSWIELKKLFFSMFTKEMIKLFLTGILGLAGLVLVKSLPFLNTYLSTPASLSYFELGAIIIVFSIFVSLITNALYESKLDKIKKTIDRDEVTGLYNKTKLQLHLKYEIQNSVRYSIDTSLIIIDIDGYKDILSTHSHQQRAILLEELSGIIKQTMRNTDFVYKFSESGSFSILLSNTSSIDAKSFAERLRKEVYSYGFYNLNSKFKSISITISIGISSFDHHNVPKNTKVTPKCVNKFIESCEQELQLAKIHKNTTRLNSDFTGKATFESDRMPQINI